MTTYRGRVSICTDDGTSTNGVGVVRIWSDRDGVDGWDASVRLTGEAVVDLTEGREVSLVLTDVGVAATAVVEVNSTRSDWVILGGVSPPPLRSESR